MSLLDDIKRMAHTHPEFQGDLKPFLKGIDRVGTISRTSARDTFEVVDHLTPKIRKTVSLGSGTLTPVINVSSRKIEVTLQISGNEWGAPGMARTGLVAILMKDLGPGWNYRDKGDYVEFVQTYQ